MQLGEEGAVKKEKKIYVSDGKTECFEGNYTMEATLEKKKYGLTEEAV